jgi:CheY-like chemotaxis protein
MAGDDQKNWERYPPYVCNDLAWSSTLSKVSSNALQFILAKPLILCIEDDPIYLILRKKVLERDGYNVIGVTTKDEALKALRESPVCATIADHMLRGTTGTELASEMKKVKPDVPIILFSGTLPEHLENVDVYVNKGEPTAIFLGIVRDIVRRFSS